MRALLLLALFLTGCTVATEPSAPDLGKTKKAPPQVTNDPPFQPVGPVL
jgi:PBP1b-binding outer membrane lipoprotein LpoB